MFDNDKNESDNQKRKHLEKFANNTKRKITGIHGKIQQKNQERKAKNEAEFKEINIRINNIINSNEPNNMKIQNLQRLLNQKSKKMDKTMLDTVKNELKKLHEIEGTNENENENENENNSNQSAMMQQRTMMQQRRPVTSDDDSNIKSPSEVFSQGL